MNIAVPTRSGPSSAPKKEPFFFEKSRLMVVAINATNSNLIYRAQTKPNGPWEADWTWIDSKTTYIKMAAGISRDGRVVVVAQTTGTPTVNFYIEGPDDSKEDWEAPVGLGMPGGVPGFKQLVTMRGPNGKVQIFGLASDTGNVWWIYENSDRIVEEQKTITPPGTDKPVVITVPVLMPPLTPWSNWQQLAPQKLAVMSAGNNGDGTIVLVGSAPSDTNMRAYYIRQTSTSASKPADWTAWIDLTQTSNLDAATPTVRRDTLGSVNVFARGTGGVLSTRQTPAGSDSFAPWGLPFWFGNECDELATGIDGDGHIVLAAQDQNGHLSVNTLTDAENQQWTGWQQINKAALGPMTLDYNADGRLTLFVREGTGSQMLWCLSQIAYNSSSWEARWTLLSKSAVSAYGVVRDLTPPES